MCKMRWFGSKAAGLVLVWNMCTCLSIWSINGMTRPVYSGLDMDNNVELVLIIVPVVFFVVAFPLSGWLADSQFGNYRVFKAGAVMLFIGSVLVCMCTIALGFVNAPMVHPHTYKHDAAFWISATLGPLSTFFAFSGGSACLVTAFQLGLDQMPDGSSMNIASYIAWFCIVFFLGFWTSNSLYEALYHCTDDKFRYVIQTFGLVAVFCMSAVLCSMFILSPKWLIIEPKSPQSLKNIFKVLKFAAKHKSPIYRSAFTYYEDEIPSRLDLGKSRYGGPFTIEQVEDVKTFLRLFVVFIPIWISVISVNTYGSMYLLTNPLDLPVVQPTTPCEDHIFSKVTYNPWWCTSVVALFHEVIIYPCLKNRLPTLLKQLGILMFYLALCSIAYSIVGFVPTTATVSEWAFVVYSILSSIGFGLVTICAVEFVCAQSPYNMRGLLSGFVIFTIFLCGILGYALSLVFTQVCTGEYCSIIQCSIGAPLGIIGFLLHLVLARWYKKRVRDEDYDLYQQVERTYDGYLSHRWHPANAPEWNRVD